MTRIKKVLRKLKSLGNERDRSGMGRFGIDVENAYGVSIYRIRPIAKELGKDHKLALELWKSGVHEARILAGIVDDPGKVTDAQMEKWVNDFDSWDVVDQVCSNLFDKTEFAYKKAVEWSSRNEEFVKRAGFTLMACLSVHDKNAEDKKFERFLPIIVREATDERNFVRKAVNWALRQIGKRDRKLNRKAIATARKIQRIDSKAARWIAADALRELEGEKVQKRIRERHYLKLKL
ncbi:MAG: DNA alkylation repair protein [Candidatus Altiarchaeota archaeon]